MKNKYTMLVITSLIVTAVALSPVVSFAKEKGGSGDEKENNGRSNPPKAIGIGNGGQKDLPPGIAKKLVKLEDQNNEAENRGTQNINKNDSNSNKVNSNKDNSNIFRLFREWFNNRFNNGSGYNRPNNPVVETNVASSSNGQSPIITGLKVPTLLNVGQTGTWTVKAYDPQNGSLDYTVDWGDSTSKSSLSIVAKSVIVQSNTFTHSYSNAGTYTIAFTVTDDNGNTAKTTSTVRVGNANGDNTLPTISNFVATSTRQRSATVSWVTNEKATSLVWYATTSPVNTLVTPNISRIGLIEKHRLNINRLLPGTKYFVVVGSRDRDGNLVVSSETSFTTKNPPVPANKAPVITGIAGTTTLAANTTGTWTVQAYDPENGTLNYSVDWGDVSAAAKAALTATDVPVVQTSTFTHVYSTAGTYTAVFTVEDDSGHVVTASMKVVVSSVI